MIVYLANPRGFCAGVVRAIDIVERALTIFGAPIYVRHAIVHNRAVVDDLKARGVVFVENLADVPRGETVIFSAHGVSQVVRNEAARRGLRVFDATCPLVTKVHAEVARYRRDNIECILIGHAGHPEVEGTMGQFTDGVHLVEDIHDASIVQVGNPERLAYVTQTTLSIDDTARIIDILRKRFPRIHSPKRDDICYATQNRQDAVRQLASHCELVLVVGSQASSNSTRLCEVARSAGADAYLIDSAEKIDPLWIRGRSSIGVTAGASAPEHLVQAVIDYLRCRGATEIVEVDGVTETITFPTPKALQKIA